MWIFWPIRVLTGSFVALSDVQAMARVLSLKSQCKIFKPQNIFTKQLISCKSVLRQPYNNPLFLRRNKKTKWLLFYPVFQQKHPVFIGHNNIRFFIFIDILHHNIETGP